MHGCAQHVPIDTLRKDVRKAIQTAWQLEVRRLLPVERAARAEQIAACVETLILAGNQEHSTDRLVSASYVCLKMAEEGFVPLDHTIVLTALAITQDAQEDAPVLGVMPAANRMFDTWHKYMR